LSGKVFGGLDDRLLEISVFKKSHLWDSACQRRACLS
jgi:hypothetical protein